MIRILQIGKFYHPSAGGIETVLRGMSRRIADHDDVSVKVLVFNNTARTVTELVDGIAVTRLASLGSLASQTICPKMPYWLSRERPDLINLHLPNPLAGLSCLLARPSCPLVVTYHADIVRQSYLMRPYLMLLNRVLRRAERIVVATPNHIKYSRILPKYRGKCTVIPFGIDLSEFSLTPEVERIRDRIRRANLARTLLFVGRLVYYKGLEYLLRAMKAVDGRLFVIGSGPLERGLKALTESLGLGGRIVFLGRISEVEKVAHLHACDLLVLPSVEPSEAFGMTQLEAMACSKPVVSTDLRSGVPYVNRHGVTGLVVKPKDSGALAEAINTLLNDSALRSRLGTAGRNLVERQYTEELMGRRYYELYLELLHRPFRRVASRPTATAAAWSAARIARHRTTLGDRNPIPRLGRV